MVGSDFLMQIGKDQIKAAWQSINQPSNQTWQLSIMAPSSPRNSHCPNWDCLSFPKTRGKKTLRGRLFFFSSRRMKEVMRLDQNAHKAPRSAYWQVWGNKNQRYTRNEFKWKVLSCKREAKLSGSIPYELQHSNVIFRLFIRFGEEVGDSVYELSQQWPKVPRRILRQSRSHEVETEMQRMESQPYKTT